MPITLEQLKIFDGWTLMVFNAKNGQRFAGKIDNFKEYGVPNSTVTVISVDWMLTDDTDEKWRPAISDRGEPITCWSGNFSQEQDMQPLTNKSYGINLLATQQLVFFFQPDSDFAKKCQQARDHITRLQQRV